VSLQQKTFYIIILHFIILLNKTLLYMLGITELVIMFLTILHVWDIFIVIFYYLN